MREAPMTAAFLGHGNPMNALETNRFTEAWRALGASAPKPRGVVVVSAHWYVGVTAVTAMERPRTIHDFYGFPRRLFEVAYPAPGDPRLAEEIAEIVKPTHAGLDVDGWGIDHGAWSVLVHAFPDASVPVVQLAIDARKDHDFHLELGARLAPLRDRGVMIVASGNVVHNLRMLRWKEPDLAFDWAERFDEAARAVLTERPGDAPSLRSHGDYALAVPTPDHFVPLLYFAGLCAAAKKPAEVLVSGYAMGSLSMTALTLDGDCAKIESALGAARPLPDDVPPEDTNL